jgi:hypothetical protein
MQKARGNSSAPHRGRGAHSGPRSPGKPGYRPKILAGEQLFVASDAGSWIKMSQKTRQLFETCRSTGRTAKSADGRFEVAKEGDDYVFVIKSISPTDEIIRIRRSIWVNTIPKPKFCESGQVNVEDDDDSDEDPETK